MVYMGSKRRLMKYLAPIINRYVSEHTGVYVEPFVGGANSICEIQAKRKIGFDNNVYLIELLNHFKDKKIGRIIDPIPTRAQWLEFKEQIKNGEIILNAPEWYVGYVGFICSFSSKFYNSYIIAKNPSERQLERSMYKYRCTFNNLLNQAQTPGFQNTTFICKDYKELFIKNAVIYCDPPYENTESYFGSGKFKLDELEMKCEQWSKHNNIILLSETKEITDPKWEVVFKTDLTHSVCNGNSKRVTEYLYIYRGDNYDIKRESSAIKQLWPDGGPERYDIK